MLFILEADVALSEPKVDFPWDHVAILHHHSSNEQRGPVSLVPSLNGSGRLVRSAGLHPAEAAAIAGVVEDFVIAYVVFLAAVWDVTVSPRMADLAGSRGLAHPSSRNVQDLARVLCPADNGVGW